MHLAQDAEGNGAARATRSSARLICPLGAQQLVELAVELELDLASRGWIRCSGLGQESVEAQIVVEGLHEERVRRWILERARGRLALSAPRKASTSRIRRTRSVPIVYLRWNVLPRAGSVSDGLVEQQGEPSRRLGLTYATAAANVPNKSPGNACSSRRMTAIGSSHTWSGLMVGFWPELGDEVRHRRVSARTIRVDARAAGPLSVYSVTRRL
jgi:hypothetical protein